MCKKPAYGWSPVPGPWSRCPSMPPAPTALLRSGLEFGRGRWRRDLARLHGEYLGALLQAELPGSYHEVARLEALGDDQSGVAGLVAGGNRLHFHVTRRLVILGIAVGGIRSAASAFRGGCLRPR